MIYKQLIKVWKECGMGEFLNKFFPQFTYCSNKIENDEINLRDVETLFKGEKVTDFKGNKRTIKEIENHKELCDNLLAICGRNSEKLTIGLIKQFHYDLIKDCFLDQLLTKGEKPGEFKRGDYVVGLHDVGVAPDDVEDNLSSLVEEINEVNITEDNALKVVSYFHCWFETIHPFADGNGRVGRMLFNYLLVGNNLPPIILFENDREEYYLALEYFNANQEIGKMVKFLDDQAYKTWEFLKGKELNF